MNYSGGPSDLSSYYDERESDESQHNILFRSVEELESDYLYVSLRIVKNHEGPSGSRGIDWHGFTHRLIGSLYNCGIRFLSAFAPVIAGKPLVREIEHLHAY